ncbi:MAG: hypothetical protein JST84_16315 [Acidobacteria bacterium]|nr:hypothetical protein [Acidobacteriota bacterium]
MNSLSTSNPQIFKGRRSTRMLFAVFGVPLCLLTLTFLLLPLDDWMSRIFAFLFLVLPCGGFGLYFLRAWWMLRQARVVVSETGIELNIPIFKAGWFFRGEPVQLRWEEVCSLDHERYALMQGGKPIDEYCIHSARGRFVLTKDVCAKVEEVVQLMMARKGWGRTVEYTPTQPQPEKVSPEQEEVQLKKKAVAAFVILLGLMTGIFLIVLANTTLMRKIEAAMAIIGHLYNLLFMITTVASIFGLWWKARRERLGLRK